MTTDPFTEAAADAAVDLWTPIHTTTDPLSMPERRHRRIGFTMGAEWARAHLAAQEPTEDEVEAAALSILADEGGWDLNDEDHAFHVHEIQWKDMDEGEMSGRLASARAALSAARAARRDEKTQTVTHYSDTTCPTCDAPPRHRCTALAGFGGAHATRVTQAQKGTP